MKNITFFSNNFPFLVVEYSVHLNRRVFVMHILVLFQVVGTERMVSFQDREKLPYLQAIICETLRRSVIGKYCY